MADYVHLKERVDLMAKRRRGMKEDLKRYLDRGDMEGLRNWLSDDTDVPAGHAN
jgi:hypothetical protein